MAKVWKSHPLEDGCPPSWASAWGQDRFGVWAEIRVGEASQRLRWIMPGRFLMGSPDAEEGRYSDEGPVHEVVISIGFWLFDTPCCQDLWEAVGEPNPSQYRGPRRPVESVSWDQAIAFIDRLNQLRPGLSLRLPREAEWEYACRAGTTAARYGELDAIAWYKSNAPDSTRDVGSLLPNPWGLYDMLGNVSEWCADGGREYTIDQVIDPDCAGFERVIRGGGWGGQAWDVRAAFRDWDPHVDRYDDLGFRCLSSGRNEGRSSAGKGERSEPRFS
jgi:formylglycine-generating enzyme required for sulfatase activity